MTILDKVHNIRDNGGRRSGFERREFSYSGYIPERREHQDRRSGMDRRDGTDRRVNEPVNKTFIEMRNGNERRAAFHC